MPQVIRVKRNATSAAVPATLDPGELAVNIFPSSPTNLYVGSDTNTVLNLVNPNRQVELTGDQGPIAGTKTFGPTGLISIPVANLDVSGGNAGEGIITDGAGNLSFAPMVQSAQQFIGSINATAGTASFTTASGAGPALPAAGPGNNGWYLITDVAGTNPPAGVPDAGAQYNIGDWLISNGTAWTHLDFGGIEVTTAADIGVVAPLTGPTVQDELESIATAQATFVTGPATSVVGNVATYDVLTGLSIADTGVALNTLATVTYVDSENAAQDLIIAANAAFVAAQPGVDSAQDALIAAAGDVFGPAASTLNHIATYADATGKLIGDGGILVTDLVVQADIASLGDVVGPATSTLNNLAVYADATGKLIADGGIAVAGLGDVKGPATSIGDNIAVYNLATGKLIKDGGESVASLKLYTDNAIAAIPGANPPLVTAPELTGDGSLGNEITFTGITLHANVAAEMSGTGLSTDPLNLTVVDGGVYV